MLSNLAEPAAVVSPFAGLRRQRPDSLLALIGLFRDDPRPAKRDLGVGMYRDETGITPVMPVVKQAERILVEQQRSKGYIGPDGDQSFVDALREIVFGDPGAHGGRLIGVQTPGGGGALRLGGELAALSRPGARIWLGLPSWPNHNPIFTATGLDTLQYRQFDPAKQTLVFDEVVAALSTAMPGDVVLLHGCCHNPTGADFNRAQWEALAEVLVRRRLVPFIDLAYQGLGDSLEADAFGARHVLSRVDRALLAYSCDKNFGLYRERTGALFVLARDEPEAELVWGNLLALARVNWSMPPDHGAACVRAILESSELSLQWRAELRVMRDRIASVRQVLASSHRKLAGLADHRGMFALLPILPPAIATLRQEHAIYMAGDGRVNLAGLQVADVPCFVAALDAVGVLG
jgi:aromatic-amino-acid transaminase